MYPLPSAKIQGKAKPAFGLGLVSLPCIGKTAARG